MLGASSNMVDTIYPSSFYETRCRPQRFPIAGGYDRLGYAQQGACHTSDLNEVLCPLGEVPSGGLATATVVTPTAPAASRRVLTWRPSRQTLRRTWAPRQLTRRG